MLSIAAEGPGVNTSGDGANETVLGLFGAEVFASPSVSTVSSYKTENFRKTSEGAGYFQKECWGTTKEMVAIWRATHAVKGTGFFFDGRIVCWRRSVSSSPNLR